MYRVYVAIPYSAGATGHSEKDRALRETRFFIANRVAGKLISNGCVVFSPISHSHPISLSMPHGWDVNGIAWYEQDVTFLENWANAMCVVCVSGWEESTGVQLEMQIARDRGIPIFYVNEDGEEHAIYQ